MIPNLVSVIIPCYNGAKYISKTMDSVMSQTYPDWEMIIIDDGSTDESAEIVQAYRERESRIHLIRQENAGSAAARNSGIRVARGQYIALLDADDLWDGDFLWNQISYMKEKSSVCVYCSYRMIDGQGKEIFHPTIAKPVITVRDMYRRNYVGCLTGLYDCGKYGKVYLREELKSFRDDYAYWLDIVKLEGKIYGNPVILASYRVLSNSTTGRKGKLIKKQYRFYRKYLGLNRFRSLLNTALWGFSGIGKFM